MNTFSRTGRRSSPFTLGLATAALTLGAVGGSAQTASAATYETLPCHISDGKSITQIAKDGSSYMYEYSDEMLKKLESSGSVPCKEVPPASPTNCYSVLDSVIYIADSTGAVSAYGPDDVSYSKGKEIISAEALVECKESIAPAVPTNSMSLFAATGALAAIGATTVIARRSKRNGHRA